MTCAPLEMMGIGKQVFTEKPLAGFVCMYSFGFVGVGCGTECCNHPLQFSKYLLNIFCFLFCLIVYVVCFRSTIMK